MVETAKRSDGDGGGGVPFSPRVTLNNGDLINRQLALIPALQKLFNSPAHLMFNLQKLNCLKQLDNSGGSHTYPPFRINHKLPSKPPLTDDSEPLEVDNNTITFSVKEECVYKQRMNDLSSSL